MTHAFRTSALFTAAALLLSCGGGDEPLKLTTLEVTINPTSIAAGSVAAVVIAGKDQKGGTIAPGPVTFTSTPATVAIVSTTGVVTGLSAGTAVITVTAGTVSGQGLVTVTPPPVSSVSVTPSVASVNIASTQQMTATTYDAQNNVLSGRTVTWSTSDATKATINASTGLLTAVALGTVTITATSEGKTGSAQITVVQSGGTACAGISLGLGEIHAMTASEKASSCISGGASGQEFVLIPFNRSTVAANNVAVTFSATNTSAIQFTPAPPPASLSLRPANRLRIAGELAEIEFRARERATMAKHPLRSLPSNPAGAVFLTGVAATPTIGFSFTINSNVTGNDLCGSARTNATATVVGVTAHAIVLSDNSSPSGGYSSTELAAWGQKFEDSVWTKITTNFGTPSDIDNNGRIAILFTPSVNQVPVTGGGTVLGLFASRDLLPVAGCQGSNVGEMFYMPVPDPSSVINNKYTDKTGLSTTVLATLAHEFQHLINAGRRMSNGAPSEEVWLNEGLSHIAEELMFYQAFPTNPRSNITINDFFSSNTAVQNARIDAYNNFQADNFGRMYTYMQVPETNSPYAANDNLETRGAIWLLLRHAVDQKSSETGIWAQFDNATATGQANFNNILGNIVDATHNMTIALFTDDASISATGVFTFPSWNFRSIWGALCSQTGANCSAPYPLATKSLLGTPVDLSLAGGGSSFLRFRVAGGVTASITGTSAGNAIPAGVDVTIVRTH